MTARKLMDVIARPPGMRGTSSRRSMKLHPGRNGRCTNVIENSKVRMSRYLGTSSKTQMAKGDPVVILERNLYGHLLAGLLWEKHFEKCLLEHGWEKVRKLGLLICKSRMIVLVCVCGRCKTGWDETKHRPNVESTEERSRFVRASIILGQRLFGLQSKGMRHEQRY